MDLKELKSMAYDRIAEIEKQKMELAQINAEIAKLMNQEVKEEKKEGT